MIENHVSAPALYFVWHNFCRRRGTLRTTPAQAAGLADDWRDAEWIVGLVDAAMPKPGPSRPLPPPEAAGGFRLIHLPGSRAA